MDIQLIPAMQEDEPYLSTLRKLTMHEDLLQAGLVLHCLLRRVLGAVG
jgi:hypothetical protein